MLMEALSSKEHRTDRGLCREWLAVWAVILAILGLTSLSCLYGYLSSPSDEHFVGLLLKVPDHAQYMSWGRSFRTSLLVPNALTSRFGRKQVVWIRTAHGEQK
jgi:hypothetical protein